MAPEAPHFIGVEEIDEAETRDIAKLAAHPAARVFIRIAQPEGLGVVDEHLVGQRLDDRVPSFFGAFGLGTRDVRPDGDGVFELAGIVEPRKDRRLHGDAAVVLGAETLRAFPGPPRFHRLANALELTVAARPVEQLGHLADDFVGVVAEDVDEVLIDRRDAPVGMRHADHRVFVQRLFAQVDGHVPRRDHPLRRRVRLGEGTG
jgi:hypothetical protein